MKKETITQIILTADDGMILTDGKTFGTPVVLPKTADENNWREISKAEYKSITEIDSPPVDEEVENQPVDEEINMPTVGEENNKDFGIGDFYS